MLIRECCRLGDEALPNPELSGKLLMHHPHDDMGFAAYYVTVQAGKEVKLCGISTETPVETIKYSHAYYCLDGIVTATSITKTNSTMGPYVLRADSFHMFPHSVDLHCNVEKKSTLLVFYVPEESSKSAENVVSTSVSDLKSTKRSASHSTEVKTTNK